MKKVFLLFAIFLLTGCSVDYNMSITKDLQINESFTVSGSNRIIANGHSSVDEGLMSKINNNYSVPDFNRFKYEFIRGTEISGIKFSRSYSNFERLQNGLTFTYLFEYYDIVEENDELAIRFVFDKEHNMFLEAIDYDTSLKSVDIKIDIPYYIIEGNYDKVENNIMIWNYKPDIEKDIYFRVDKNISSDGNKIETKNNDKLIIYVIIALFVILTLGFGVFIFLKKQDYNKF